MNLAFRTIAVYVKLALIAAVGIVLLLVVLMNRDNRVDFWFFQKHEQVNVLYIILITAIVTVFVYWIVARIRGIFRQWRAVRDEKQKQRALAEQQRAAKELAEREKRIDEKLQRSLEEPTK